jgi:hypothetical protein
VEGGPCLDGSSTSPKDGAAWPTYAQLEILCLLCNSIVGWRAGRPLSELAAAEKIDRGYLGKMLRLTLLAPDIIDAILDGRQPTHIGLPALLEPMPSLWDEQRSTITESSAMPL